MNTTMKNKCAICGAEYEGAAKFVDINIITDNKTVSSCAVICNDCLSHIEKLDRITLKKEFIKACQNQLNNMTSLCN